MISSSANEPGRRQTYLKVYVCRPGSFRRSTRTKGNPDVRVVVRRPGSTWADFSHPSIPIESTVSLPNLAFLDLAAFDHMLQ